MNSSLGSARFWVTVCVLLSACVLRQSISHGEPHIPRAPLRTLADTVANWKSQELPLEDRTVQAVGVTDYINRLYVDQEHSTIQLYVGYYASQRTGDTIHSPKNCLPGAGWDPVYSGYATISGPEGWNIVVNEYVIQRGQNKQLVFYWYQGRGRVVASEYWGKLWLVVDALSRDRTDDALVRLSTSMDDDDRKARARLVNFTLPLFPRLDDLIPK